MKTKHFIFMAALALTMFFVSCQNPFLYRESKSSGGGTAATIQGTWVNDAMPGREMTISENTITHIYGGVNDHRMTYSKPESGRIQYTVTHTWESNTWLEFETPMQQASFSYSLSASGNTLTLFNFDPPNPENPAYTETWTRKFPVPTAAELASVGVSEAGFNNALTAAGGGYAGYSHGTDPSNISAVAWLTSLFEGRSLDQFNAVVAALQAEPFNYGAPKISSAETGWRFAVFGLNPNKQTARVLYAMTDIINTNTGAVIVPQDTLRINFEDTGLQSGTPGTAILNAFNITAAQYTALVEATDFNFRGWKHVPSAEIWLNDGNRNVLILEWDDLGTGHGMQNHVQNNFVPDYTFQGGIEDDRVVEAMTQGWPGLTGGTLRVMFALKTDTSQPAAAPPASIYQPHGLTATNITDIMTVSNYIEYRTGTALDGSTMLGFFYTGKSLEYIDVVMKTVVEGLGLNFTGAWNDITMTEAWSSSRQYSIGGRGALVSIEVLRVPMGGDPAGTMALTFTVFPPTGCAALGHDWNWATYTIGSGVRNCQRDGCSGTAGIGDTGPAGGIIFYVASDGITIQGYGSSGDNGYFAQYTANYMEAAPANETGIPLWQAASGNTLIDGITTWADSTERDTGLAGSIGVGRKDTQTIVNSPAFAALENTAAQRCASKTLNGFTDWFLPSLGELNEFYKLKGQAGVPQTGIPTAGLFWSSSQRSSSNAWDQDFNDGVQYADSKGNTGLVRAVRAF